jgi:septal ring factor EnvC (AmiA/AmiB activator)
MPGGIEQETCSVCRVRYYRCTKTMHFDNSVCTIRHINANRVEGLVVQKLSELSQNEAYLKMTVEELNSDIQRKTEPLEKQAGQIKKRLDEIEREIGRYVKALGQGKLSIERLEEEIGALNANKRVLQDELHALEQKINESTARDYNAEILQKTLQDFRTSFMGLTPAEQSEALQCVLKNVVVHPQKLALEVFELDEFLPGSQNRKDWLLGASFELATLRNRTEWSTKSRRQNAGPAGVRLADHSPRTVHPLSILRVAQ